MNMPVKLSRDLVEAAREESARADRSITAQIEHWARIGRAAEQVLPYETLHELKARRGKGAVAPSDDEALKTKVLETIVGVALSDERSSALRIIKASGVPRYAAHPVDPARVVQVTPDGLRREGRMVGRDFVPDPDSAEASNGDDLGPPTD